MSAHTRSADGSVEGDYSPVESCKDSFKYRLVQENGRYRFESVRFEGLRGCSAGDLAEMVRLLEGRWLDEIDIAVFQGMQCRSSNCRGCPQEVARMIQDIREILLPTERLSRVEALR